MSVEALLAAGYATALVAAAFCLEWLSAHTHRRSLRYRTFGFTYHEEHDHWTCPEGEHLWLHEYDQERRLARYRAKAHICNGCPRKAACTDSDRGREIVRPLDPWPHSEAGRFHRVIAVMLVVLATMICVVALALHHHLDEAALLVGVLVVCVAAGRWLARDLHRHPSGFPAPGMRVAITGADGVRARSRWASLNREQDPR